MAVSTTDLYVRPEDGWVLVATDPVSLLIKPQAFHPWWVAITASGAPAATLVGVPMGRDNSNRLASFETGEITGEVYIRIKEPASREPTDAELHFAVIKDEA